MQHHKYPYNVSPIKGFLKAVLGIEKDEDLEKDYPLLGGSKENKFLKEKPIHVNPELTNINLCYRLLPQINGEVKAYKVKPSRKQVKEWTKLLKKNIYTFIKNNDYSEAISLTNNLLELKLKGNSNCYYRLRNLYVKDFIISEENRENNINKIINLEKIVAKDKTDFMQWLGMRPNNLEEHELILNILEDCKENLKNQELVLKMMKFVDNYYSQEPITI